MSTTEAFKTAMCEQWDRAAAGWDAHADAIRAWLRPATDAMLEMAGVRPGARVLDVACGAGDQTLDIAGRVGPTGLVLATDLSPEIVRRAQANVDRAGLGHVRTEVMDGERLEVDGAAFDAAVCRLGLMFFPDPLRGLKAMHRALRPGTRACVMVFSRPDRNPCVTLLMRTALEHAGLPPRDPFQPGGLLSLGRPGHLEELFRAAGFRDVATVALDAPFRLRSVLDYVAFVRASASPVMQILAGLDPAAAEAAWADIERRLAAFDAPSGWVGPNELLLASGRV